MVNCLRYILPLFVGVLIGVAGVKLQTSDATEKVSAAQLNEIPFFESFTIEQAFKNFTGGALSGWGFRAVFNPASSQLEYVSGVGVVNRERAKRDLVEVCRIFRVLLKEKGFESHSFRDNAFASWNGRDSTQFVERVEKTFELSGKHVVMQTYDKEESFSKGGVFAILDATYETVQTPGMDEFGRFRIRILFTPK